MRTFDLAGRGRIAVAPTRSPSRRPSARPGRSGVLRRSEADASSLRFAPPAARPSVSAEPEWAKHDPSLDDRMIVDPDFDGLDCLPGALLGGSLDGRGSTAPNGDD